mmetsp:Transcript_67112/g.149741  ORF Transcript_67112/g.149741 Transcript_67112/m.149741 type:complete len:242 (-) Transcript_67112:170-895(-)
MLRALVDTMIALCETVPYRSSPAVPLPRGRMKGAACKACSRSTERVVHLARHLFALAATSSGSVAAEMAGSSALRTALAPSLPALSRGRPASILISSARSQVAFGQSCSPAVPSLTSLPLASFVFTWTSAFPERPTVRVTVFQGPPPPRSSGVLALSSSPWPPFASRKPERRLNDANSDDDSDALSPSKTRRTSCPRECIPEGASQRTLVSAANVPVRVLKPIQVPPFSPSIAQSSPSSWS